jgi:hypothetical protein
MVEFTFAIKKQHLFEEFKKENPYLRGADDPLNNFRGWWPGGFYASENSCVGHGLKIADPKIPYTDLITGEKGELNLQQFLFVVASAVVETGHVSDVAEIQEKFLNGNLYANNAFRKYREVAKDVWVNLRSRGFSRESLIWMTK